MYDKGILSEKVAEDIKAMIKENDFQPGDKLPNELVMTDRLNVSRSTVREAIKILVSTNILEVKRGRGTFVCENPGVSDDPLGIDFIEEDNLLPYFFEMRLIIEPEMVKMAVERGSKEDIEAIKEAFKLVEDLIIKGEDHSSADIDFHNAIAKASGNPIMERVLPIIGNGIIGGYSKTKSIIESANTVLKHHKKIMDAIEGKQPEEAKAAMREHIKYGYERSK